MTRVVAVTEFKAQCLQLLDTVSRTGGELVVTKRGRALAVVRAARKARSLRGTVRFNARLKDLLSTGAKGEAARCSSSTPTRSCSG